MNEADLDSGLPPNFDGLARTYRWLEYLTFGPCLHRVRTYHLNQLADRRHALLLGDGDGRFTAQLLAANPAIRITAIDASPAMLRTLVHRSAMHAGRLTVECADLREWLPGPETQYDLIATHFFLDCLTTAEVIVLAQRLRPVCTSGALWAVSDFAVPSTRFGRFLAAPLVSALYGVFRALTGMRTQSLPDSCAALTAAGFTPRSSQGWLNGLLVSELWGLAEPGISGESISTTRCPAPGPLPESRTARR